MTADSIPTILSSAQVVHDNGKVYLKNELGLFHLSISPKMLIIILNEVDGGKTIAQISLKLRDLSIDDFMNFFLQLEGKLFSFRDNHINNENRPIKSEIVIIGNGELASNFSDQLALKSQLNISWFSPDDCPLGLKLNSNPKILSNSDLSSAIGIAKMIIVTLEGVEFDAYYRLNEIILKKEIPCLYIIPGQKDVIVGPTMIPGKTACFECLCKSLYYPEKDKMKKVLSKFKTYSTTDWTLNKKNLINRIIQEVIEEISNVLDFSSKINFSYTHFLERLFEDETRTPVKKPLIRQESCNCFKKKIKRSNNLLSDRIDVYLSTIYGNVPKSTFKFPTSNGKLKPIGKIGIVGGGTAGYLTAIALRKKFPLISVDVIESSKIPAIGVGEGTTPFIRHFLHETLGIDITEFFDKVKPTWKLGVKFLWGKTHPYFFNYPFGHFETLPALLYEKDINKCSLNSMLMNRDASPIMKNGSEADYLSMTENLRFAYHLDNTLFTNYLKIKAIEFGANFIDTKLTHVNTKNDSSRIKDLVDEKGRHHQYDLYIDCSGFKSLLIGESLGSPFKDYKSSLFTDTALVAKGSLDVIRPYTISETLDHGWCWSIPTQKEYHFGYVFSSDYCSIDEAWEELRQKKGLSGDPKTVKFRPGRHEHFWKGNVVAIGNSYGFVEPLEATGIHMIIEGIENLIHILPQFGESSTFDPFINRKLGDHWDYLRWFLSIHYKFNKRSNSEFWKSCNEDCDITGIQNLINLYMETGPLSTQPKEIVEFIDKQFPDPIFGRHGFDHILLGQQIKPNVIFKPLISRDFWSQKLRSSEKISFNSIPQNEAFKLLQDQKD